MSLGAIIKAKRLKLGLTGPKASQLYGVHPTILSKLEHDKEVPEKSRWLLTGALQLPFNGKLFSEKVREKRESLGTTIAGLSKITKVSISVLYFLEGNKKIPSMVLCYKIAKVLKLNLEDFIDTAS